MAPEGTIYTGVKSSLLAVARTICPHRAMNTTLAARDQSHQRSAATIRLRQQYLFQVVNL